MPESSFIIFIMEQTVHSPEVPLIAVRAFWLLRYNSFFYPPGLLSPRSHDPPHLRKGWTVIMQDRASLSSPAFREQIPLESLWGSMGITRPPDRRLSPASAPPVPERFSPAHSLPHRQYARQACNYPLPGQGNRVIQVFGVFTVYSHHLPLP